MKNYLSYGLYVLLLLAIITGCKKEEYVPPAEGEKIPYVAPGYKTLEEVLKASPCRLFLKAYQRSNMDSLLRSKASYTLLAPTDAVMQAAGYTDAAIAAMTRQDADSLVAYYTLRGVFTKEELQTAPGNRQGVSLLVDKNWMQVPIYYENGLYCHQHYIIASGDSLLVNGEPAGALKNALPASNGYLYPIDRLLPKALPKTFWEVVQDDPRFSMFKEVQANADDLFNNLYRQKCIDEFFFDPGPGWQDFKRTNYKSLFDPEPSGGTRTVLATMMFVPVNEAFYKAGFQTVSDVMAWNNKYATPVVVDWNIYDILPYGFPSDTVLAYHWDFGHDNLPWDPGWTKHANPKTSVFFANDLRDDYLANFPLNIVPNRINYLMPYSFGRTPDGRPTVKVKGSDAGPATIIGTINTYMGPMHIVDRLLIPNKFKMQ